MNAWRKNNLGANLAISVLIHSIIAGILLVSFDSRSTNPLNVGARQGFAVLKEERSANSGENATSETAAQSAENAQGLLTESANALRRTIQYPELAYTQDIEGDVRALVRVEDGKLLEVRIIGSSGYSILDNAVTGAIQSWTWPPVTGETTVLIKFRL